MRKLKVYGVQGLWRFEGKMQRVIAAVYSKKDFAKLVGCSLHYINGYAAETGNKAEVEAAMEKPYTLIKGLI